MATIVHIDVASDKPERAKKFYEEIFGWKFFSPGMPDYYLFETAGLDGTPGIGGGLGLRGAPEQRITCYIGVDSIDEYCSKIVSSGGKVLTPKMTVPGWGYLANCTDTEGNVFGIWQEDKSAK